MKNLILMVFLSFSTILNANQSAFTLPLLISEHPTECFFWGILDVQQRVGKVSIKQNAPVEEVTILVTPNNGNEKPITVKKGKICNLKDEFPSATKCYIKITAPSDYSATYKDPVNIDRD